MSQTNSNQGQAHLFSLLAHMGDFYRLNSNIDNSHMTSVLKNYEKSWSLYNPRKNIKRYGLSLANLDGEVKPGPDLDSLKEYNKENNTNYKERDFHVKTPLFHELSDLSSFLRPIEDQIYRSHVIKLDAGGFFPPHRDMSPTSFRLLCLLGNIDSGTFVFLLNGKRVWLETGCFYFVNTRIEHSVFSFVDNALMAIFNVELSDETVDFITNHLYSR